MIRVKAAFFSFTPPAPRGDDGSYLRWHLLDHMPEQYQLPGIQLGLRYVADGDYPDARIASSGPLQDVGNVVNYLVGDPVQQTHDDFMQLGRRLAEVGRFPERRPSLQLRMPALLRWHAAPQALISAEVVPFRPHRGVLVVVEEPVDEDVSTWLRWLHTDQHPAVLETPGVAGVWMYGSTSTWALRPATQGDPQYTTVIYVDDDPLMVTRALAPRLEERWRSGAVRPLFAGPLRTMIDWEAWR
ncbi:MAG: hypothetical protein M3Z46_05770 [Actinomycetota bacterium]|nr:hypothetical protein [Actinomycetota bacterium]